jgi:excisionase family DNA binding protein
MARAQTSGSVTHPRLLPEAPKGKAPLSKPDSTVDPRLLTVSAAAAYLSCAVWAVRVLLWKKEIPFIRLGKRFLIDRADLDDFVERRKESAA